MSQLVPVSNESRFEMHRGVQFRTMPELYLFAETVVQSGLAPSSFKTPNQVLVAIQYGAELGLAPMQSLQSIAVINGKPGLYGDALPALVWASGKCEYVREHFDGHGDGLTATCESKRKDSQCPVTYSFSVADAKLAGLWGKAGPWKQYPKRMLQMRARAFNFRDNFADVLRGFGVVEEIRDYPQGRQPFDPEALGAVRADSDHLLAEATGTQIAMDPVETTAAPVSDEPDPLFADANAPTPEEVAAAQAGLEMRKGALSR